VTAVLVVDAAALGVPTDEWLGFTARQRDAIIHEHNARMRRK
jgi:hypothetical protein